MRTGSKIEELDARRQSLVKAIADMIAQILQDYTIVFMAGNIASKNIIKIILASEYIARQ